MKNKFIATETTYDFVTSYKMTDCLLILVLPYLEFQYRNFLQWLTER